MTGMKKNNKGLSLVELVIVVAIITIFAGFTLYNVANIPGYRARECSRKITSNLNELKVKTLGKAKCNGDYVWVLHKKNGQFYIKSMVECHSSTPQLNEQIKISKGRLTVTYLGSSGTPEELEEGKAIKLCFDRASGALYACGSNEMSDADSDYATTGSLTTIKEITVKGGAKTYTTKLVAATGKVID